MNKKIKICLASALLLGSLSSFGLSMYNYSNYNNILLKDYKEIITEMNFISLEKENEFKNILSRINTPNDMTELTNKLNWNEYLIIKNAKNDIISDNPIISVELTPIFNKENKNESSIKLNAKCKDEYFIEGDSNILSLDYNYYSNSVLFTIDRVFGVDGYDSKVIKLWKDLKESILKQPTYALKKQAYEGIVSKENEIITYFQNTIVFTNNYTWASAIEGVTITKGVFPLEDSASTEIPPINIQFNLKIGLDPNKIEGKDILTINITDLGYYGTATISKISVNRSSLVNILNKKISHFANPLENNPTSIQTWLNSTEQEILVKNLFGINPWYAKPEYAIKTVKTKVTYPTSVTSGNTYWFEFDITLNSKYQFDAQGTINKKIIINGQGFTLHPSGPNAKVPINKMPGFDWAGLNNKINQAFAENKFILGDAGSSLNKYLISIKEEVINLINFYGMGIEPSQNNLVIDRFLIDQCWSYNLEPEKNYISFTIILKDRFYFMEEGQKTIFLQESLITVATPPK